MLRNITIGLKGEPDGVINRRITQKKTPKEFKVYGDSSVLNQLGDVITQDKLDAVSESKRRESPDNSRIEKIDITTVSDDEMEALNAGKFHFISFHLIYLKALALSLHGHEDETVITKPGKQEEEKETEKFRRGMNLFLFLFC